MTAMEMHLLNDKGIHIQDPISCAEIVYFKPKYFYNSKWLKSKHDTLNRKWYSRTKLINRAIRTVVVTIAVISVFCVEIYGIIALAQTELLSEHSASMCGIILVGSCFISGILLDSKLDDYFPVNYLDITNRK